MCCVSPLRGTNGRSLILLPVCLLMRDAGLWAGSCSFTASLDYMFWFGLFGRQTLCSKTVHILFHIIVLASHHTEILGQQ